jgi:hypothetical protein
MVSRRDKMKSQISFTLRIDEELMEELKKIADKEQRSANSQIVYLIQKCVEEQKNEFKRIN